MADNSTGYLFDKTISVTHMSIRIHTGLLASFYLATFAIPGASQSVQIGAKAPPITVKRWAKGSPVSHFASGTIYVVEFWATWCAPCQVSMAHLTQLQRRYKQVVVIGVSVLENGGDRVQPYVDEMDHRLGYRVAEDGRAGSGASDKGPMWRHWMAAAGQSDVPTAFIVNREGTIAWIGHPLDVDIPLHNVVSNKWDMRSAAEAAAHKRALDSAFEATNARIVPLMRTFEFATALEILDRATSTHKGLAADRRVYLLRLTLLAELGRFSDVLLASRKLIDGDIKRDVHSLNELALTLLDLNTGRPEISLEMGALAAAQHADKMVNGTDAWVADTLAAAYFAIGNQAEATYVESRAIVHCSDMTKKASMMMRYDYYRASASGPTTSRRPPFPGLP